jgi:imidazolonepropionase-like amidohydrolase
LCRSLRIIADRVFDGSRFARQLTWIDIEGDRIARVTPVASGDHQAADEAPPGTTIDARGATVLPGLVNAHVHIARTGYFEVSEPLSPGQIARNLATTLAAGVTSVGDMGCPPRLAAALRKYAAARPHVGPTIYAAGPLVTVPRGYPLDWMPRAMQRLGLVRACRDARDGRRAAESVAAAGMDHVKLVVMHRSYGEKPLPAIDAVIGRAIVEEAHASGLRVFAHAHTIADYRVALESGVDALMHCCFEPLDAETLARVRDAGVPVCSTLWVFESVCLGAEAGWHLDQTRVDGMANGLRRSWARFAEAYAASGDVLPPGVATGLAKARAAEAVRIASANLKLLVDAGISIAYGDDAAYGFCVHGRPLDELGAMRRAGLGNLACLRAATSGAAALLGRDEIGSLAPGKRADVLISGGDLEVDLDGLRNLRGVIRAGRIVSMDGRRARSGGRAVALGGVLATAGAALGEGVRGLWTRVLDRGD